MGGKSSIPSHPHLQIIPVNLSTYGQILGRGFSSASSLVLLVIVKRRKYNGRYPAIKRTISIPLSLVASALVFLRRVSRIHRSCFTSRVFDLPSFLDHQRVTPSPSAVDAATSFSRVARLFWPESLLGLFGSSGVVADMNLVGTPHLFWLTCGW
jgi:hypothetical protein